MNLEPIDPETALELYLKDKANEFADASLKAHKYRLDHFIRWCDQENIVNLNNLTGRQLHKYRLWRREDGDLNKVSEKTQMDTLRVFIRWLESIDGVKQDLSQKVLSPDISPDENTRDVMIDDGRVQEIFAYCEKYEYATLEHVTLSLMWHTMMRTGSLHALDVGDYHPDEQYIEVRHRPDTGTPIKNKGDGERLVALSGELCELLTDWIEDRRPQVTDDAGREPLLASDHGRLSKGTIRTYSYRYSRPCMFGNECPHDRDPAECEATKSHAESKCPSSVSPHAFRRGSITYSLNNDVPGRIVSDRANVSQRVIDLHYDRRTEREKMEQRREFLDNL